MIILFIIVFYGFDKDQINMNESLFDFKIKKDVKI